MGTFGERHFLKIDDLSSIENYTCWKAPQKRESPPHVNNNVYLSDVADAKMQNNFFHVASMSVLRDANSCCVPLDVHQQTTALVTGNHSTAAMTGSYLHKLPQNT